MIVLSMQTNFIAPLPSVTEERARLCRNQRYWPPMMTLVNPVKFTSDVSRYRAPRAESVAALVSPTAQVYDVKL